MEKKIERELPLRQDWRYRPYDISTFTLAPGQERVIFELRRHGWIVVGGVACNNPDLRWIIELETGTEMYRESASLREVFTYGHILPMAAGWWVSRWDTVANLYFVSFAPASWWPFYRMFRFSLLNPTDQPITVYRVGVLCIEFIEPVRGS